MEAIGHTTSVENASSGPEAVAEALDARMREGSQTALAEVFAACRGRLLRIADFRLNQRLRVRVDADDVLQEAFLAASQRLGHYAKGPYTSPFLWLRSILSQTLIDLHRRHVQAQRRSPDRELRYDASPFPDATATSMAIQLAADETLPGEAAARADMMNMMEGVIGKMEPIDQEILALRHFEELSNREVAEILGIEQKAASIRYVRALRRLRNILVEMSGYFRSSG